MGAIAAARNRGQLSAVVRDLADLSRWDQVKNGLYLVSCWGLIFGSMALVATEPAVWTFALAFCIVSSRQQALLNVSHECIHGLLAHSKRANEWIAVLLCAYPCGSPFFSTRTHHLTHHKRLGQSDDPDAALHRGADKETRSGLLRHFIGGLFGGYALRVLIARPASTVDATTQARDRRNLVVSQLTLGTVLTVTFGWWAYPLLWLAPLVTLTTGCHLVRSFCEHALEADEEASVPGRLVSLRSNAFERFMLAPYSMNFHAEHHMFPWIPAPNLSEVQRRMASRDDAPTRVVRAGYAQVLAAHLTR